MEAQKVQYGDKSALVQFLTDHLSSGSIELPSFPDVVIRLREVLEDEQSTTAQIVQLLSAEPALSARLLKIANSAALLLPGTAPITDPIADTPEDDPGVRENLMYFLPASERELSEGQGWVMRQHALMRAKGAGR